MFASFVLCIILFCILLYIYFLFLHVICNLRSIRYDGSIQLRLYCRALTKRSISQNFQNIFFGIIHISPTISILCQKILAENCLQCTFLGTSKRSIQFFVSDSTIKTLYLTLGCIIHQIQRTFTTLRYGQWSQIMYDTYQ